MSGFRWLPRLAGVAALGLLARPAAAQFVVTNDNDSGAGSLREAILQADGDPNDNPQGTLSPTITPNSQAHGGMAEIELHW